MTIRNDTVVIAGNIGTDPTKGSTRTGTPVINFRVASSTGYFDQRTGAWVEGDTNWYKVAAFGSIAEHARASLHCGDPVIVVGRLKTKEWEANGKKGIDVEITADAIGHDLNKGTSAFVRRAKAGSTEHPAQPAGDRGPADSHPTDADAYDEPGAEERDAWGSEGLVAPDADADEAGAQREDDLAYA